MKTKKLTITAMFIALCFIGANIKIAGTIAFDSLPAFLGTLMLGPVYGAVIGMIGHFLTAATSGFPFGLPAHLMIMCDMALTMALFGMTFKMLRKKNEMLAYAVSAIVAVIINGPVSVLMLVPLLGPGLMALIPVLSGVAAINVVLALVVYKLMPKDMMRNEG